MTTSDHRPNKSETTNRNLVGSLLSGISILDMFDDERRVVGIGEMAAELGVHKSSASRMAATLAHAGYLRPTDRIGQYRLGGRLLRLARLAESDVDLSRVVTPHLLQLTEVTGETGHLAVMEGSNTTTLDVTDGWHTVRMHSWAGKVSPAYCSSMGKAILSGMSDEEVAELYEGAEFVQRTPRTNSNVAELLTDLANIRARGYGYDDEELEMGLRCVSAPIVDATGQVIAGISISAPKHRFTDEHVLAIADHVRRTAAAASRDLGHPTGVPEGWPSLPDSAPPGLDWVETARAQQSGLAFAPPEPAPTS